MSLARMSAQGLKLARLSQNSSLFGYVCVCVCVCVYKSTEC